MENPEQVDPDFLKNEAYDEAVELKTRIQIQEEFVVHPQDWFHWLFDQFDLPVSSRILELGSGTGDLWLKNMDRLPPGWEIDLSDFSPGMLSDLRETDIVQARRFTFYVLDAQAIPFPMNTFDAVVGNGLADHLPDRKRAFEEILRILRPGGKFYTSTGGREHLKEFEELVRPFLPEKEFGGDPDRFGLENGERILSPWFQHIRCADYRSRLSFDHVEPILEYIFSEGGVKYELAGEALGNFKSFLQEKLASEGVLHVTLEKGVFEAGKS